MRTREPSEVVVGTLVGMAYVVPRRDGRFEIRESVQTERGPRCRTLANFAVLTEDVLGRAEDRAHRPFDRAAVAASAMRRGARIEGHPHSTPDEQGMAFRSNSSFVASSRRFANVTSGRRGPQRSDSGRALNELIAFAEEITRHQPRRRIEPLDFPALHRLVAKRNAI